MQIPVLIFAETFWHPKLEQMFQMGRYQATTKEEFEALKPYASDPVPEIVDDADQAKAPFVARALELKIGQPSVLARWSEDRLQKAIADAEAKIARTDLEAKAIAAGLTSADEVGKLSDADLAKLFEAK